MTWTAVEDGLPETFDNVWATDGIRGFEAYYFDGKWTRAYPYLREVIITHWMPLPDLPEE